jgi:hypothetical protein
LADQEIAAWLAGGLGVSAGADRAESRRDQ